LVAMDLFNKFQALAHPIAHSNDCAAMPQFQP
jgi:hypothetical protein